MNPLGIMFIVLVAVLATTVAVALLVAPESVYRSEHSAVNGAKRHENRGNPQCVPRRQSPRDYPCRVDYTRESHAEQADNYDE